MTTHHDPGDEERAERPSSMISHRTTETLPGGATITTLHLTPDAKRGLSTEGATIPPRADLTVAEVRALTPYDYKMREHWTAMCVWIATTIGAIAINLGVPAASVVMWPAFGMQLLYLWRSERERKARKRARLITTNPKP